MIVVADTSPINYLILIGEIETLTKMYGRVVIPRAVREELLLVRAAHRFVSHFVFGIMQVLTPAAPGPSFRACNALRRLVSARGAPQFSSGRSRPVLPGARPCFPLDNELALSQGWAQRLHPGQAPRPTPVVRASRLFPWPTP